MLLRGFDVGMHNNYAYLSVSTAGCYYLFNIAGQDFTFFKAGNEVLL